MGKQKKLKAMRRLARELPPLDVNKNVTDKVTGSSLIAKGLKEDSSGKALEAKITYKGVKRVAVPVNHYNQMKHSYKTGGSKAVGDYISMINQRSAELQQIEARHNAPRLTPESSMPKTETL